jgi:hypothetical protein
MIISKSKFWEELIAYFPLIRHGPTRKWSLQQFFVVAGTCLLSRCLATIRGCTYGHTDWWEGFMKYDVELGSDSMIYIPSFIKIFSGIRKLICGGNTQTYRQHSNHISLFYFFQNKESSWKFSWIQHRVVKWKLTDVSEKHIASIFMVECKPSKKRAWSSCSGFRCCRILLFFVVVSFLFLLRMCGVPWSRD